MKRGVSVLGAALLSAAAYNTQAQSIQQVVSQLCSPNTLGLQPYTISTNEVRAQQSNVPPTISFSPSEQDNHLRLSEKHRAVAHQAYEETIRRRSSFPESSASQSSAQENSAEHSFHSTSPLYVGTNAVLGAYAFVSCNRIVPQGSFGRVESQDIINIKNMFTSSEPVTLWTGFTQPTTNVKYYLYKEGVSHPIGFDMSMWESGLRWTKPNLSPGNYTAIWSYQNNELGKLEFSVSP